MVRSVLALVLVSRLALAQDVVAEDTPLRMYQPQAPELVGYPNWVLTPDGKGRLDDFLERQERDLTNLRTVNAELRATLTEWQSKPALTPAGVAILLGVGVVVGAGAATVIAVAAR